MDNVISIHENDPSLDDAKKEIQHDSHMLKLQVEAAKVFGFISYLKSDKIILVDDVQFQKMQYYAACNDVEYPEGIDAMCDYFIARADIILRKMVHLKNSKGE